MTTIDTLDDNSIRFSLLDMDDVPRQSARTTVPALARATVPVAPTVAPTPTASATRAQTPAASPVAPVASNPPGIETWAPPVASPTPSARYQRPLAADVAAPLRAGIESARARPVAPVARTRAQIEREEAIIAARQAREAIDGAITIALGSDESGEFPHGCLVAWDGLGEWRWETIARVAESVGIEPPKARTHKSVASEAVRSIATAGLKVDVIIRGREWSVYRRANVVRVGESIGDAELVARLNGEHLELIGPDDLVSTVRYAWERARRDAILGSTELSTWLTELLTSWRAVRTVHGRWIAPGYYTETWIRLVTALAAIGVPIPSEPAGVSSRRNIRGMLVSGLVREVKALIAKVATERAHSLADGSDFGVTAASNKLSAIADIRAKLSLYEALTGPLPDARAELDALANELEPLANGVAQRGGLLEFA